MFSRLRTLDIWSGKLDTRVLPLHSNLDSGSMIEDPPVLTIRRDFERPAKELLEALAGIPSSFVVDAMNGRGAMAFDIRPLTVGQNSISGFVGTAMPCYCGPADNLALMAASTLAKPGDVIIAATDRFEGTSLTGDLLLGMAKNRGVAGLVTDGLVRDVNDILSIGLPVFCRGITANSPARNGPGTVGLPVTVGDVVVNAGDIIVADQDAVVVVPQMEAPAVLDRLKVVQEVEAEMNKAVQNGLQSTEYIVKLLDSDRVKYIE